MEKQKEHEAHVKRINDLRKKIEKKEKKLQKVNRVLKAQTHVKQKLKEVNKPETDIDGSLLARSNVIPTDQKVHKPNTKDEDDSLSSPINQEENKQKNDSDVGLMSLHKRGTTTKQQLKDKTFVAENQLQTISKKSNSQEPCKALNTCNNSAKTNQPDIDIDKFDVKNNKKHKVTVKTAKESNDMHVCQAGVGNKIQTEVEKGESGDSEESPILIVDSQPPCSNTSSLSTDDSQNSKLGTKRGLSLKRKGKANRASNTGVLKRQKFTGDVTLDDHSCTMEKNLIQQKNQESSTSLKEPVIGNVETSDSLSILQQYTEIGEGDGKNVDIETRKEQDNQCSDHFEKHDIAASKLSNSKEKEGTASISNNSLLIQGSSPETVSNSVEPKKTGRPSKCTNQHISDDKSEIIENNVTFIEPSQDIVIACTPEDSTTGVDLNKGFICGGDGQEVVCTQSGTDKTKSDVMPNAECNVISSSQETLVESAPEDSQPKRRGRPSRIKRRSGLLKSVLKISPVTDERKGKIKDTDKDGKKNDKSCICEYTNSTDDIVIECTPDVLQEAPRHISYTLNKDGLQKSDEKVSELRSMSKDKDFMMESAGDRSNYIINSKVLISSQESTSSGTSSDTIKPKRKRGRPPKQKPLNSVKTTEKVNFETNPVVVQENKPGHSLVDSKEVDEITIPESQDLYDKYGDIQSSHNLATDLGHTSHSQSSQNDSDKLLEGLKDSQKPSTCNKNPVHESPELSTLKLIQESFVEKKEYSTRRRSSTGSPFMISSIFQFIIDESRRSKEKKDFDLPFEKFGKLLKIKTESQETDMKIPVDQKEESEVKFVKTEVCCEDINKNCGMNTEDNSVRTLNEDVQLFDKLHSQTNQEILQCNTKTLKSEIGHMNEISETNDQDKVNFAKTLNLQNNLMDENVKCEDNFDREAGEEDSSEVCHTKLTSSQSLFTPNPKEENKMMKSSTQTEMEDSQTDSIESLCEDTGGQDLSSFELPVDDNVLVDICTCPVMFRRKEVPVLGCLSTKSLSLWRYHNGFSFLYKWDFLQNQKTEHVTSFSIDGKAFFITLIKTQERQFDVYISYYSNKKDNFIYTVTSLHTDFAEVNHVNNHVVAACFNEGETIQVKKLVLHQNWKSLLKEDRLESTEGSLKSLHTVDNLPDAVCVWTRNAEFCLWNHENKKLLLKIKPDHLMSIPQLVGAAWEHGYFFLQFFYTTPGTRAGIQVILNPSTKRFCTNSEYKIKEWKGCHRHHTLEDTIVTLDGDSSLCVWDRYTTELMSVSNQGQAKCVSIVTGEVNTMSRHIVTGGDNCVHIH